MTDQSTLLAICPYCNIEISSLSKDHIFPQFLGGKNKIICCKNCNNTFGHTFEAESAKILQPMQVFIQGWGIPLKITDVIWKADYMHNGRTYNFSVGEKGIKPQLAKPFIEYDEMGQIKAGEFIEKKHAEQVANSLIEKGKAKEVKIEFSPSPEMDLAGLEHTLVIGPDIRRIALKMCMALGTLLPDFNIEEICDARSFLTGENSQSEVDIAIPAYDIYEIIDSRRKALSHVIYVERGKDYVSGFVQFFGVIQLYCHLGTSINTSNKAALFASLDPVTGEEEFLTTPLLNLEEPPYMISLEEYPTLIEGWLKKYQSEAIKRGATNPPNLNFNSLEIQIK